MKGPEPTSDHSSHKHMWVPGTQRGPRHGPCHQGAYNGHCTFSRMAQRLSDVIQNHFLISYHLLPQSHKHPVSHLFLFSGTFPDHPTPPLPPPPPPTHTNTNTPVLSLYYTNLNHFVSYFASVLNLSTNSSVLGE